MVQLPKAFIQAMTGLLGPADCQAFSDALQEDAAVSFRPNGRKGFRAADGLSPVAWSSLGYYLSGRPAFTYDPLLHAGAYYVQEASSMAIEQALQALSSVPRRVLDLCASPGGKSTLLRSLLPDGTLLVSNEPLTQRAQVLAENMQKWGHPDCLVTTDYPRDFGALGGYFDLIAVDAPCSGEGMFRKDNPALDLWSPANVRTCAQRQREILSDVWPALREGGHLIYSTCTYNLEENELNVDWICRHLGAETIALDIDPSWGIIGNLARQPHHVYHFMPHKTRGEGFFFALLRKTSPAPDAVRPGKVKAKFRNTSSVPIITKLTPDLQRLLKSDVQWQALTVADETYAIPASMIDDFRLLAGRLNVISAGVPLTVIRGHKVQPHPALPLSIAMGDNALPRAEISKSQALDYLRHQALTLPSGTPRGYVVITYQDTPLGLANNLGSRANNLYPMSWRIRSGYTQEWDNKFCTRITDTKS